MNRTFLLVTSIVVTAFLSGCESDGGKAAAGSAAPSATTTVKQREVKSAEVKSATDACADYEKALADCIAKQEGDGKKQWQDELDNHKKAFAEAGDAAKTQMEGACVTGLATVKQGCQ